MLSVVTFVVQSPYKAKVVLVLGKETHSKPNDFRLFSGFSISSFQVLLLLCVTPEKAAALAPEVF